MHTDGPGSLGGGGSDGLPPSHSQDDYPLRRPPVVSHGRPPATPLTAALSLDGGGSRGGSEWFGTWEGPSAFSGATVAVEAVGEAQFARARAPLFEKVQHPHAFTAEERARMDTYESIDYDEPQSFLRKTRAAARMGGTGAGRWSSRGCLKWAMFIAIGVAVGLWAVLLFQTLDYLAEVKLDAMQDTVRARQRIYEQQKQQRRPLEHHGWPGIGSPGTEVGTRPGGSGSGLAGRSGSDAEGSEQGLVSATALLYGYGVFALWSVIAAMLSSLCCVVMPSAAGSGIPDVMAYLNGIMFPRIFNIRNLLTKTLSCVLAVSAGLPVGTEGPIIHIGSLIGAGLPTGRSRSMDCGATSLFRTFRNAKDERDFISAGAACGLTAAFSSPLGGMLFVLEEIATFFPVRLAWRVLVSCLSAMCVTQYVNTHLSGWRVLRSDGPSSGGGGSSPSTGCNATTTGGNFRDASIAMFYLGTVPENLVPMNLLTFFATVIVAVLCGYLAVAYTVGSVSFSRWRTRRLFPKPVLRVLEPGAFALLYATASYALPLALSRCRDVPAGLAANRERLGVELVTAFCASPRRQYHPLATLAVTNPYNLLRLLFSRRTQGLFPTSALLLHLVLYTAGSSYAGGLFISCGTVIPSLLMGAVAGRLVGEVLQCPAWADPGVLALVGSAAFFSGISRLTFSLIVVMMELTADLTHVTCLMLAVIVAKGIADRYCHSLYGSILEMKAAPLLEVHTSIHEYDTFSARDIATAPVVTLSLTETVVHVLEVLHATTHSAFPVTHAGTGTYAGMIGRAQLQELLWAMVFREQSAARAAVGVSAAPPHGSRGVGIPPPSLPAPPLSLAESQRQRERWLAAQRHATREEIGRVRETIFWERLPALPPPGCLGMDVAQSYLDLSVYVELSPPYVLEVACVSRVYYLFRHLGLRHLPVLDRHMRVVGILTRTNFIGDRLQEKVSRAAGRAGLPRQAGLFRSGI